MEAIKTRPREETRAVNSLGMFDMLKGLGMVMVIFAHTLELYQINTTAGASLTTFLIFIYREALMSAFYMASGYGFRPRPIGKCVKQQVKSMLMPYIYTALATAGLHLCLHYYFFRSWENAVTESWRVFGGFALGLPHTAEYFGVKIFSAGPMWYLLTLAVGWIVLDIVLTLLPERAHTPAVLGVMALGWASCRAAELPYCISQGMTVTPYLYMGYRAKRGKLFEKPLTWKFWLGYAASAVCIAGGAFWKQATDSMSKGEWTLGPVSILLNGVIGFGCIHLFTRWNRKPHLYTRLLERIGRRSLVVFCLHTVELQAVPWYLFAAHFADRPLMGVALQFGLRAAFILVLSYVVGGLGWAMRTVRRRLFPKKRAARPAHETMRV